MIDFLKENADTIFTYLPLTIIVPFFYTLVRKIFNSFATDDFDLIFLNKEERTLTSTIKSFFKNLALSLFIFITFFICAYILDTSEYLLFAFFAISILLFFVFVLWLIFYYFIGMIMYLYSKLKSISGFKSKIMNFFDIALNYKPSKKYAKFDEGIKFLFIYVLGIATALTLINSIVSSNENDTIVNLILFNSLLFTLSLLFVLWGRRNLKSYSTHYKFVESYDDKVPFDLYLDRIVDNSTHILSDEENTHKAIKYLIDDGSKFVLHLYKLEKREILRPWSIQDESVDQIFPGNHDLNIFYKELAESNEEIVEQLRQYWETIKEEE